MQVTLGKNFLDAISDDIYLLASSETLMRPVTKRSDRRFIEASSRSVLLIPTISKQKYKQCPVIIMQVGYQNIQIREYAGYRNQWIRNDHWIERYPNSLRY